MDFESYLRGEREIPFEDAASFHSILRRPPTYDSRVPRLTKEAKLGILKLMLAKHAQGEEAEAVQAALMTDPNVQQALDHQMAVAQAQHSTQQLVAMQQQLEETQQGMQALQQQAEQTGQALQSAQQENSQLQEQLQGEMQMRQQANMQALQANDQAMGTRAAAQQQRMQLSELADQMSLQLKQVASQDPEQAQQQQAMAAQQQQMAEQEAAKAQLPAKQRKEVEQAEKAQQQAQVQGQQAEQAMAQPQPAGPMAASMQQQAAAQQAPPPAQPPAPPAGGGMVAQSAAGMRKIDFLREKLAYFYLQNKKDMAVESRPRDRVAQPKWQRDTADQKRDHFENFIAMAERKKGKPLTEAEADEVVKTYNSVTGSKVPLASTWNHGSVPWDHFGKEAKADVGTAYRAGRMVSGIGDIARAAGKKMPKVRVPKELPLSERAAFHVGRHRNKYLAGAAAAGAGTAGVVAGRASKEKNSEIEVEAAIGKCAKCGGKVKRGEMMKHTCTGTPKLAMVPPPTSALKARLLEAGIGAGLGAMTGAAYEAGRQRFSHMPPTQPSAAEVALERKNRAAQIKQKESPTLINQLAATKTQAQLDAERDLRMHPQKAILRRALQGAVVGAAAGPALASAKRNLGPRIMG